MTGTRETAERKISGLAVRSLLLEVSLAPKPGLVTPYDNGSHKDMNFEMFVRSALALSDCFAECAAAGRALSGSPPHESLGALKKIGTEGESAMYRATGGVNTHKGAVYLLGLLCAATGRAAALRKNSVRKNGEKMPLPREAALTAASFVQGVVRRELESGLSSKPLPDYTAGERAYASCGLTGARGEVEGGYPLALEALDFLKSRGQGTSFKNALTDAFFFIVSRNGDTNLYRRGGAEGLRTAQKLAGEILLAGGMNTPEGRGKIRAAERLFVEKNLSSGGSADVLSSAVFLHFLPSLA